MIFRNSVLGLMMFVISMAGFASAVDPTANPYSEATVTPIPYATATPIITTIPQSTATPVPGVTVTPGANCPQLTPPAPGFIDSCKKNGGVYAEPTKDANGCWTSPKCITPTTDLAKCKLYSDGCNDYKVVDGKLSPVTKRFTTAACSQQDIKCIDSIVVTTTPKADSSVDLTNCARYFDGCNTCTVVDGKIGVCTKIYCQPERMKQPRCLEIVKPTARPGEECPKWTPPEPEFKEKCLAKGFEYVESKQGPKGCPLPPQCLPKPPKPRPENLVCGGIAGVECPKGFACKIESNVVDGTGVCVKASDSRPGDREPPRVGLPEACRQLTGQPLAECLKENRGVRGAVKDYVEAKKDLQEKRQQLVKAIAVKEKLIEERVKKFSEEVREKRAEVVEEAKKKAEKIEESLKEYRSKKASLTEAEKKAYGEKATEFLEKQVDHRIATALKLEIQGANANEVKAFVDYATAQKQALTAAKANAAGQKKIIVELNKEWSEFRKEVAKELLSAKLESSVQKAADVLARENDVITTLSQKGYDVSSLQTQSAKIGEALKTIAEAPMQVKQAERQLAKVRAAEVHLKNSIQRVVNKQAVAPLPEPSVEPVQPTSTEPVVAISAEVAASVKQVVETEASVVSDYSASATPTSTPQ